MGLIRKKAGMQRVHGKSNLRKLKVIVLFVLLERRVASILYTSTSQLLFTLRTQIQLIPKRQRQQQQLIQRHQAISFRTILARTIQRVLTRLI